MPATRTVRATLAAAAAASATLLAPAALAGPEHCGPPVQPAQVETLTVEMAVPRGGLRLEGATRLELAVRREATEGAPGSLEGAHVSLRVRTGRVTSFVDGTVDSAGRAALSVTLDRRASTGPAIVLADVWWEPVDVHWCYQVVREHGAAEAATQIRR